MHNHHNRTVKINKQKLIEKIEANKQEHIKDYNEAVIAYKKEAQKLINKCQSELNNGSLEIGLSLVSPLNRSDEYDKVIEMFRWELSEEVEITQNEFNEYVHDDNQSSKNAKYLNSTYR